MSRVRLTVAILLMVGLSAGGCMSSHVTRVARHEPGRAPTASTTT
jgi:hypothetical protein